MLRALLAKVVCCVLVIAVPAAAADMGSAVLAATASSVNGKAVSQTSTVFDGDQIAVADHGQATISVGGSTVVLPAQSSIRYAAAQIQLDKGAVAVSTRKGMGVKLGDVTIAPATAKARYQVSNVNGTQRIQALEGALTVSNGTQSYTLPAGKEMTRSARAAAPQTGAEDFGLPGWAVAGIIAAGLAVMTGVIVATQGDESPTN